MELTNVLMRYRGTPVAGGEAWYEAVRFLILMLAPAAPHLAEELWQRRLAAGGVSAAEGSDGAPGTWSAAHSVHRERWPSFDQRLASEETIELPIQVNGKLRDRVVVPVGLSQDAIEEIVLGREKIVAALAGRSPKRVVHVPGRLVNLVV
jgi:leucyl-tRNA synthetase